MPQRARGRIHVALDGNRPGAGLRVLHQQGSAKARLPDVRADAHPEIVLMNTAGGMTGGDHFRYEIELEDGAAATVTTPSCERVYRSSGGSARVEAVLRIGDGCRLEWLPQETILFDQGRLERRIVVSLAPDAALLAVEAMILGRAAHGETVRSGLLRDRWHVSRAGRLVFADATVMDGPIAAIAARPAVLNGGTAYATLVYAAPDAEARRDGLRELPGTEGVEWGASTRDGVLIARFVARDGLALRGALVPALSSLRDGVALPRVWTC